jgi:hypothetical protein
MATLTQIANAYYEHNQAIIDSKLNQIDSDDASAQYKEMAKFVTPAIAKAFAERTGAKFVKQFDAVVAVLDVYRDDTPSEYQTNMDF